ncbi:MAG: 50S ribosomal protein L11 [Promethearchaeota archaeon]
MGPDPGRKCPDKLFLVRTTPSPSRVNQRELVKKLGSIVTIDALVDGGKASGGPPIGPAVGPTGVPVIQVVRQVNELTEVYKGMKVPVQIIIDKDEKTFEVIVKTPMTSALLFKEAGVEKGSSEPNVQKVGNLTMEQVKTVTTQKREDLNAATFKDAMKTVLGSCVSAGLTVEGKDPRDIQKALDDGEYSELWEGED